MLEMPFDNVSLQKVLKFVVDNRGKTAPTAESGIALIATNCVSNDDLYPTYKNVRYVSPATHSTWFRAHPQPGDILLTLKGSQNGAVCLVPDPVDFAIAQDMVALRADGGVIDPLFLFAALRSNVVKEQIRNLDVSGIIPHFKKTDFDKLHLPYPNRSTQAKIGELYFQICAKIELKRRMNETLEAMARAIFKDWFVDFGPVRAKQEGRAPYLAPDIWSLFPDRLDDEGKPGPWLWGALSDVAELNWGDTNTTKGAYVDEGYTAFSASGPDGFLPYYDFDRKGIVLSAIGANCGVTWLALEKWSCIKNTIKFWPISASMPIEYLFLATQGANFWPTRGSAQPFISQGDARAVQILIPDIAILRAFGSILQPFYARIARNAEETSTLAALRDLLLPKLMSGEIRIKDAETLVGQAA